MNALTAALAGALFAVGLALSGMTQPARVIGFLDVTGEWDPALAFVMGGALLVYGPLYRIIVGRLERPLLADAFHVPPSRKPDAKLLGGAALFGVGWGLAGLCPGPALVALGAFKSEAALFTLAMIAGSWLGSFLTSGPRSETRGPRSEAHEAPSPRLAQDDA